MAEASEIRSGQVLKIEGGLWKVISHETRGKGKLGKTVHFKLKNLEDGHTVERSFKYEDQLPEINTHRLKMQYLYRDGDQLVFMNPEDYSQPVIPAKAIGKQDVFLKENMEMDVLLEEERVISVEFPEIVELKVVSAPEGGKGDHVGKEIELENGLKVIAPQFVKTGESVRINTQNFSYLDRVTTKSMSDHSVIIHKKEKEEKK